MYLLLPTGGWNSHRVLETVESHQYLGVLLYDADRIEEAPSAKLTSLNASAKCSSIRTILSDRPETGIPQT